MLFYKDEKKKENYLLCGSNMIQQMVFKVYEFNVVNKHKPLHNSVIFLIFVSLFILD